jgi:hypothetical protein
MDAWHVGTVRAGSVAGALGEASFAVVGAGAWRASSQAWPATSEAGKTILRAEAARQRRATAAVAEEEEVEAGAAATVGRVAKDGGGGDAPPSLAGSGSAARALVVGCERAAASSALAAGEAAAAGSAEGAHAMGLISGAAAIAAVREPGEVICEAILSDDARQLAPFLRTAVSNLPAQLTKTLN